MKSNAVSINMISGNYLPRFTGVSGQTFRNRALLRAALTFLVLLTLHQAVYLQKKDAFGVNKDINDVKKRFKLSSQDVRNIRPLINRANENIFDIYARFSGDEPEYSDRVWHEIISRRCDFESFIRPILTQRQKAAVLGARTKMERRILNYLVEDYVRFLGDVLGLGDWEYNILQDLFESENRKKYQLIETHLSDPVLLRKGLETISRETESELLKILSGEQWRQYRSLTGSMSQIA